MEFISLDDTHRPFVAELLAQAWGGPMLVGRGRLVDGAALPGLVALEAGRPVGVLLYELHAHALEVWLLHSVAENRGVGSGLLKAAAALAKAQGCRRLFLVTSNDNIRAIRFYQRQGMRLTAAYIGAMDAARATLKPQLPLIGDEGIPLRDELEFELIF